MGGPVSHATLLTRTTHLVAAQGNYEGARPLYERSLALRENVLGPDHPDVASSLNDLAGLLDDQVRVDRLEVWSVGRLSV